MYRKDNTVAAYTKYLKDKNENTIYPVSKASAVYLEDATTVEDTLGHLAASIDYSDLPAAASAPSGSTIPITIDNVNKIIDYDVLAQAILNLLTSKKYALTNGQQTLVAAINQAQTDLNSIKSKTFLSLSV